MELAKVKNLSAQINLFLQNWKRLISREKKIQAQFEKKKVEPKMWKKTFLVSGKLCCRRLSLFRLWQLSDESLWRWQFGWSRPKIENIVTAHTWRIRKLQQNIIHSTVWFNGWNLEKVNLHIDTEATERKMIFYAELRFSRPYLRFFWTNNVSLFLRNDCKVDWSRFSHIKPFLISTCHYGIGTLLNTDKMSMKMLTNRWLNVIKKCLEWTFIHAHNVTSVYKMVLSLYYMIFHHS